MGDADGEICVACGIFWGRRAARLVARLGD